MTPAALLVRAIGDGLTVSLEGDRLAVRPVGQLADELRQALVEQRQAVMTELSAATSMPALLAPTPARPCTDCARLHAGVWCEHYQANIPVPGRLSRCIRFQQKQPALPW